MMARVWYIKGQLNFWMKWGIPGHSEQLAGYFAVKGLSSKLHELKLGSNTLGQTLIVSIVYERKFPYTYTITKNIFSSTIHPQNDQSKNCF